MFGLSRSNLSSTKESHNCFTTYTLVNLALALNCETLPVFSSNRAFFSSQSAVLILSFCCYLRLVVSFLIVFPEDVLHTVVDLRDGKLDLSLSPRMQRFLNMAYYTSVFLSHSIMTIDPFFSNIALQSAFRFFLFPILVLCTVVCLTLRNAKVIFSILSAILWHFSFLQVQSSSPAQSVATLSQTHSRLCQLHVRFYLVWLSRSFFTSIAFVVCHHFVLLRLNACFSVLITAFGFR